MDVTNTPARAVAEIYFDCSGAEVPRALAQQARTDLVAQKLESMRKHLEVSVALGGTSMIAIRNNSDAERLIAGKKKPERILEDTISVDFA